MLPLTPLILPLKRPYSLSYLKIVISNPKFRVYIIYIYYIHFKLKIENCCSKIRKEVGPL